MRIVGYVKVQTTVHQHHHHKPRGEQENTHPRMGALIYSPEHPGTWLSISHCINVPVYQEISHLRSRQWSTDEEQQGHDNSTLPHD